MKKINIKNILKHGTLFDKDNEPVIIKSIARRDIREGEELYYYGQILG